MYVHMYTHTYTYSLHLSLSEGDEHTWSPPSFLPGVTRGLERSASTSSVSLSSVWGTRGRV